MAMPLRQRQWNYLLICSSAMNGYKFIQRVRQQLCLGQEQLPAIALTAYTGEYIQQQAIRAGFQQHLAKPIEPEGLVSAIASLISTKSPRPTPT
jgi:CheY-like chemotaxis protein